MAEILILVSRTGKPQSSVAEDYIRLNRKFHTRFHTRPVLSGRAMRNTSEDVLVYNRAWYSILTRLVLSYPQEHRKYTQEATKKHQHVYHTGQPETDRNPLESIYQEQGASSNHKCTNINTTAQKLNIDSLPRFNQKGEEEGKRRKGEEKGATRIQDPSW